MAKKVNIDSYDDSFADDLGKFLQKTAKVDVVTLSEQGDIPYWIPTRCYALNWIISNNMFNGWPGTRIGILSGESGKGKSLLSDVLLGENVRLGGISIKIDIEVSGSESFTAKVIGDEEVASKIRIINPQDGDVITIEKLMKILNKLVDYQISSGKKNRSILIVIDSVTQLSSDKEVSDVTDDKDTRDMTAAQASRKLLRVLSQKLPAANTSIVGIAQLTANIGVMFGPKTTVNAKGSGFPYASSLTLQLVSDKEIVGKNDVPIGIRMKMKTTKNRCAYKGRNAWLHFYFNKGIDPYGGLAWLLAQYGVITPIGTKAIKNEKVIFYETKKGDIKEKKADKNNLVFGTYIDEIEIGDSLSNGKFKVVDIQTKEPEKLKEVKPESDGSYDPKYLFVCKYKGKILTFKASEIQKIIEENGGDEMLQWFNDQLNKVYEDMTEDMDEAELLDSDDPEELQEYLEECEE